MQNLYIQRCRVFQVALFRQCGWSWIMHCANLSCSACFQMSALRIDLRFTILYSLSTVSSLPFRCVLCRLIAALCCTKTVVKICAFRAKWIVDFRLLNFGVYSFVLLALLTVRSRTVADTCKLCAIYAAAMMLIQSDTVRLYCSGGGCLQSFSAYL